MKDTSESRPGRWMRADHATYPAKFQVRLRPDGDYDIRIIRDPFGDRDAPAVRKVSAAYVRAEFVVHWREYK